MQMLLGWIFLAVFVTIIVLISLGKLEESIAALLGGSFMGLVLMFYEGVSFEKIIEFANFKVLLAFLGIMIIVQISIESGIFHLIAIKAVKMSKSDPLKLFIVLNFMAAIIALFISALAAIIIIGSLTIMIAKTLKTDPEPYMISEAIMVDIGSLGLMFSFPAIIMTQIVHLDILFFLEYTFPFMLFAAPLSIIFLNKKLSMYIKPVSERRKLLLMEFDEWSLVPSKRAFYSTGIMLSIILILMLTIQMLYIVAFIGSLIMLFISGLDPEEVFEKLPWNQVFFIAGLSVMVEAINHEGVLAIVGEALANAFSENILLLLIVILWVTGILSGIIDNIPVVLTFIPIIKTIAVISNISEETLFIFWAALLIAAVIGGDFQTYGSSSAILAKGITESSGYRFSTSLFFKIGREWTLLNLSLGTIYITVLYFREALISKIGLLFYLLLFIPGIFMMAYIIFKELGVKRDKLETFLKRILTIRDKFSKLRKK